MANLEVIQFGIIDDQASKRRMIQHAAEAAGGILLASARTTKEAINTGLLNGACPVLFLDGTGIDGEQLGLDCRDVLDEAGLAYNSIHSPDGKVITIGSSLDVNKNLYLASYYDGGKLAVDWSKEPGLGIRKLFSMVRDIRKKQLL